MSELKAYRLWPDEVRPGVNLGSLYYLKSEADKVITHQKYKRCLAMAKWCKSMMVFNDRYWVMTKWLHYNRWHKRWLELAEKFKEAK